MAEGATVRFITTTKEKYEKKKAEGSLDLNAFYRMRCENGSYEFYLGDTRLSNNTEYDEEDENLIIE